MCIDSTVHAPITLERQTSIKIQTHTKLKKNISSALRLDLKMLSSLKFVTMHDPIKAQFQGIKLHSLWRKKSKQIENKSQSLFFPIEGRVMLDQSWEKLFYYSGSISRGDFNQICHVNKYKFFVSIKLDNIIKW